MAKVKPSAQTDSTVPAQSEEGNQKKSKRKRFWAKETSVTKKAVGPVLPPRLPGEYSTNWKALQQLMNQKTDAKKVTENKSKIRTKEETCGVEKEPHRGMQGVKPERGAGSKAQPDSQTQNPQVTHGAKPERGAGSKAQPDSQTASVPLKINGLKPDKSVNHGNQNCEKKRRINGRGPPEEDRSARERKRTKVEPELENPKGPDIWFDDVDPDDIETAMGPEAAEAARRQIEVTTVTTKPKPTVQSLEKMLVKDGAFEGLTKAVAMDCEMVGVGSDKVDSILARVSIVNQFGKCVYDKYVKPTEKVTDYRTWVSGVRPSDVKNGEAFKVVQREVADILDGRMLVGHAVHNDLKILLLGHPKRKIRDTQKYKPFKAIVKCGRPSLKHLCQQILKIKVQESEHSSVQDAQATMRLYTLARKRWEAELKAKHKTKKKEVAKEKPNPSR